MADLGPFVMMTVALPGKVSLAAAARRLGLSLRHLDERYGPVLLDADKALYTVRVKADAAASAVGSTSFADPKIRPLD